MQFQDLDGFDNEIIHLLKENARMTYSEIGERIGLSRTAVKNRMKALEESGIIQGYRAVINPLSAGQMMPFIVNIDTAPEHFMQVKEYLERAEQTVTLLQTTGRCHLLAICMAENTEATRKFVNGIYSNLPGILSINAHAVIEVCKGRIMPD